MQASRERCSALISFDSDSLGASLEMLDEKARLLFALCVATRQGRSYKRFFEKRHLDFDSLDTLLEELWNGFEIEDASRDWNAALADVMSLIPTEDDWIDLYSSGPLAQDAVTCLAYAIRCELSGSGEEAVWAAESAYTAADQAALKGLRRDGRDEEELTVLSHPFVRRELERQARDLATLAAQRDRLKDAASDFRKQSYAEQMITDDETKKLPEHL